MKANLMKANNERPTEMVLWVCGSEKKPNWQYGGCDSKRFRKKIYLKK
jgi:hypothetical protein